MTKYPFLNAICTLPSSYPLRYFLPSFSFVQALQLLRFRCKAGLFVQSAFADVRNKILERIVPIWMVLPAASIMFHRTKKLLLLLHHGRYFSASWPKSENVFTRTREQGHFDKHFSTPTLLVARHSSDNYLFIYKRHYSGSTTCNAGHRLKLPV